jgi:phage shock protein PspC (stress-responsive transcriptional regulator)
MPVGPQAAILGYMNDDTATQIRTFRRSTSDRMVAGVCAGAAKQLGIDTALLRVLLVAATLFGFGAGAVVYLICWILVPEEESA